MRTSKEAAEQILVHIQRVADARMRPMMGEYIVYVDEKVAGQINHGELFIKVTSFGEDFAEELEKESPYEGAKLAFVVPRHRIEDTGWLKTFLAGTVEQL